MRSTQTTVNVDAMEHDHHRHGAAGHSHHATTTPDAIAMAAVLDLDAAVCGEYLDAVPRRLAELLPERTGLAPITVFDLGSGTGVGSVALARRFPTADIVALDASEELLRRTRQRADDAGVGDRVRTAVADLDSALPTDITHADVAWASSTLHHFADPDALLCSVFDALRPGGLLAIVEIAELPTFLPPNSPDAALERRIQPSAGGGWHGDLDWSSTIRDAGFEIVDTLDIVTNPDQTPSATNDYAATWLGHMRSFASDSWTEEDQRSLDALLSDDHPSSLRRRDDLSVHARRTAWIARKPV